MNYSPSWKSDVRSTCKEISESLREVIHSRKKGKLQRDRTQPNPPLNQGNRQPPHKTKNEAQVPHKQKAETYRSKSGQEKPPPPPPHSNKELQKQKNNGHK